jgi:hypothetical protein
MKASIFLRACAVCIAAASLLILAPAIIRAAVVANSSFEADGDIDLYSNDATGWSDNVGTYDFLGDIMTSNWHTDESSGVTLLAQSGGYFYSGDNAYLKQTINLTGISSILFDSRLSVHPDDSWLLFLEAGFYIDGLKKWSSQTPGTYLGRSIDLSGMTGTHTIEFRLQANAEGRGAGTSASWYEFDNVRVTAAPEPSALVLISVGSVALLAYRWRRRKPAV